MKKFLILLLALCMLCPLSACQESEAATQTVFVMDTFLTVTLYRGDVSLLNEGFSLVREIESKMSRTLETSEVAAFNRAESAYTFSDETASLLARALAMSEATDGAYDITTAPLSELWNIPEGGPVPSEAALTEALSHVGYEKLTLQGNTLYKSDPAVRIDLGSVAKGYALDCLCDYLEKNGAAALVNFGGNIGLVGEKPDKSPWRVSIRDPFHNEKTAGTFTLDGGYVAVSGDYERFFEENGIRYHHILSPFDGMPIRNVHSVAIAADNAADADMLSTALFVLGEEDAAAFAETSALSFTYTLITDKSTAVGGDRTDRFAPTE